MVEVKGLLCTNILILECVNAIHHLELPAVHLANRQDSSKPLVVTNNCVETIYPAILTQSGFGPLNSGFRLDSGQSNAQSVSADWRGRVWGRTNCTFNDDGTVPTSGQGRQVCSSGDCGNFIECQGAGNPPATLAEFTLSSLTNQAFYDISLVDGYNLPMGIVFRADGQPHLEDIPPNFTNAICIGTASLLTLPSGAGSALMGGNSTYPIPLEQSVTVRDVLKWCPWPLQLNPPQKPSDGVFSYPDDNIARPEFNPCFSACAKYNSEQTCCSGIFANPKRCRPSYYSLQAKKICPDAYSFAFDDQSSTFVLPQGGGFEVVFCPKGRSSVILKTFGNEIRQVASRGVMTPAIAQLASNTTYIKEKSEASSFYPQSRASFLALAVLTAWSCWK